MSQKKLVLIVGGGFAGRRAERLLRDEFDVTLVDAKGFFEYTPSALRCMVEPNYAERCVIPQPQRVVIAAVESINLENEQIDESRAKGVAHLNNGTTLAFDYCLLCLGSSYVAPIKPDPMNASTASDRVEAYQRECERIQEAEDIVIVGGGTVGVELAAEIVGKWPKKKNVTLINSQGRLLSRMPEAAGRYAQQWLETRGCDMILQDRVMDWGNETAGNARRIVTKNGRVITAALLYSCIGFEHCSAPLAKLFPSAVSERGAVIVNDQLQVKGMPGVFAVGDCTNTGEEKNALNADLQASLAAENIRRLARGAALQTFPSGVCHGAWEPPSIACVSLYKWHGTMQFNGLVINGRLPTVVKHMIENLQAAPDQHPEWRRSVWRC
ncbi:hypothetical protein CYMTET_14095 [Cymbomonas tetramitiformis]|uniref:FAD/NAD(P)-binding domain-containing protein n=1 Tax=Cymbomonas tetramitiformis TaxID=36881 RepID=A0AAE0GH81_9CHLO|nr:hypothetical protein CYMTET_14095 [Cymbomonas tetramitiformis]